jgi:hypothetical protein
LRSSCFASKSSASSSATRSGARRVSVAVCDAHLSHLVTLALSKADIIQYWYVLRGASRSSYESARTIFGHVAESAASRLTPRSR